MRYAMICYDLHYDYSSHNDTNFTVRRFLEKSNEFIQVNNYEIVVKLFHISHNSAIVHKFTTVYPVYSTYELTKQFV